MKNTISIICTLQTTFDEIRKALAFTGFKSIHESQNGYIYEDTTVIAEANDPEISLKYTPLEHGCFFDIYIGAFNDVFDISDEMIANACDTHNLNLEFDDCIYNIELKEPCSMVDAETECSFCKIKLPLFTYTTVETLNDKYKVCPNCFIGYLDEIIKGETIQHKCDCCDEHEVLKISTSFKPYYLCKKHLIDFACLNLDKQAFKALYQKDSKGNCDFYLHDDFYSENGVAFQPNDEYAKELKEMLL